MGGIYWLASYPGTGAEYFVKALHYLRYRRTRLLESVELDHDGVASDRNWLDDVLGFDTADLDPQQVDDLRAAVHHWNAQDRGVDYRCIYDANTYTRAGQSLIGVQSTAGALYIMRNPVDVVVRHAHEQKINIDEAITRLGDSNYVHCTNSPLQVRQQLLTWSSHVLSWVDTPNLKCRVIKYEDILADPHSALADAARFLKLSDDSDSIEMATSLSGLACETTRAKRGKDAVNGFTVNLQTNQQNGVVHHRGLSPEQITRIINHHGSIMRRFGYLDAMNRLVGDRPPLVEPRRGGITNPDSSVLGIAPRADLCFSTTRFTLRPLMPQDVTEEYIQWWNDEAIQAGLNSAPRGWSRLDAENQVRGHDNQRTILLGVVRKGGRLIGFVRLQFKQASKLAELTVVIGSRAYWGKRVADEVIPAVFDYFFANFPTEKIKAMIIARNRSSLALAKRVGFEFEGILRDEWQTPSGDRTDVHVFSVLRRNWLNKEASREPDV